jgi:hypothetical protein
VQNILIECHVPIHPFAISSICGVATRPTGELAGWPINQVILHRWDDPASLKKHRIMEQDSERENEDEGENGNEIPIQHENENEEDLEAFAMNNAGTGIVVFLMRDDHLRKCCERRED